MNPGQNQDDNRGLSCDSCPPRTSIARSQSCCTFYRCGCASKCRSITTFRWVSQHPQPESDDEILETPNPQERLPDLSEGYSKLTWESSKKVELLDWWFIRCNSSKLYRAGFVGLLLCARYEEQEKTDLLLCSSWDYVLACRPTRGLYVSDLVASSYSSPPDTSPKGELFSNHFGSYDHFGLRGRQYDYWVEWKTR